MMASGKPEYDTCAFCVATGYIAFEPSVLLNYAAEVWLRFYAWCGTQAQLHSFAWCLRRDARIEQSRRPRRQTRTRSIKRLARPPPGEQYWFPLIQSATAAKAASNAGARA